MAGEFQITQLRRHIYQLQNTVGNCATLVLGREKALLFDTMVGLGDLRSRVEDLTALPLVVVNSHGHFDHVGGNYQFETVYLSRRDWPLLAVYDRALEELGSRMGRNLSGSRVSYHMADRLRDLRPGTVFDLGGVTAQAVSLPGHTGGSMGLYLPEDRLLLAGDAISPEMCLFFPESMPVETYIRTLRTVMDMDIDYFIQGHYARLFPKSLLEKFLACAGLPGHGKGHGYVNTLIPSLRGTLYILEFQNRDAGGTICIITKESGDVSG